MLHLAHGKDFRIAKALGAPAAELLKISRQQAHVFLKSLFEKGFIGKKGSTKNSYYFLK